MSTAETGIIVSSPSQKKWYEDEEKQIRTVEDILNDIDEIREVIADKDLGLSVDDIQSYVNDLKALEEELEELQEEHDDSF